MGKWRLSSGRCLCELTSCWQSSKAAMLSNRNMATPIQWTINCVINVQAQPAPAKCSIWLMWISVPSACPEDLDQGYFALQLPVLAETLQVEPFFPWGHWLPFWSQAASVPLLWIVGSHSVTVLTSTHAPVGQNMGCLGLLSSSCGVWIHTHCCWPIYSLCFLHYSQVPISGRWALLFSHRNHV